MARKGPSDEDIRKLLRNIELTLANGSGVKSAFDGVSVTRRRI